MFQKSACFVPLELLHVNFRPARSGVSLACTDPVPYEHLRCAASSSRTSQHFHMNMSHTPAAMILVLVSVCMILTHPALSWDFRTVLAVSDTSALAALQHGKVTHGPAPRAYNILARGLKRQWSGAHLSLRTANVVDWQPTSTESKDRVKENTCALTPPQAAFLLCPVSNV